MPSSWLSLGELLRRQAALEAQRPSVDRERRLKAMKTDPPAHGVRRREEPDPEEFEDHAPDDRRRADAS